MDRWWGSPKKFTPRMKAEVGAMQKAFNTELKDGFFVKDTVWWDQPFYIVTHELKPNISQNPLQPFWRIVFSMKETDPDCDSRSRSRYELRVQYSIDYPEKEPQVTIPSHKAQVLLANHIFPGGVLCLHNHSSIRTGWDPGSSTAATFAIWSVEWVRAWNYSKRNNNWPAEG